MAFIGMNGKKLRTYHDEERIITISHGSIEGSAYCRIEEDKSAPRSDFSGMRIQSNLLNRQCLDLTFFIGHRF